MNKQKLISIFEKHAPKTVVSEDETMIMFQLLTTKDKSFSESLDDIDKESEVYQHFLPLLDSFIGKVFLSRINAMTSLKMSLGALAILMQYMETPGSAVMYTFYLYHKLPENTVVTVQTIDEVFPWGFFSKEQLKEIWDAQKVNPHSDKGFTCVGAPDNMIDYLESWI